MKIKIYYM